MTRKSWCTGKDRRKERKKVQIHIRKQYVCFCGPLKRENRCVFKCCYF